MAPPAACQSVLEQDTEPRIDPDEQLALRLFRAHRLQLASAAALLLGGSEPQQNCPPSTYVTLTLTVRQIPALERAGVWLCVWMGECDKC